VVCLSLFDFDRCLLDFFLWLCAALSSLIAKVLPLRRGGVLDLLASICLLRRLDLDLV